MQNQKKAGQAEDWELSEEYYREDTGKKELRLEDFLKEEPAEADRAPDRSDCCHAWYGRTADQGYPGVHAVLPGG